MLIVLFFCIGYILIIAERAIRLDKAATALITAVICWVICIAQAPDHDMVNHSLHGHLAEIAGIVFFLIGAMTIVELIDLYDGFQLLIDRIKTTNKRKLLAILTIITFFLSALLDNLTTAIVMTSVTIKLLSEKEDRLLTIGMIVIAANAGGAWSPIGDVTTTMLWIGNNITPGAVTSRLLIPSLVSAIIPLLWIGSRMKGDFVPIKKQARSFCSPRHQSIILLSGLTLMAMVPVFKAVTHLPPMMGMMLAVGLLWLISERLLRKEENQETTSIFAALERIDLPSILFFLGILLSVGAMQTAGLLDAGGAYLANLFQNDKLLVFSVGLLSAIFDNVPIVAALQGMYDLSTYPTDHFFWTFLAYCSGTGGSILIIGSAAGVAAMGIENIDFFWYLKRIAPIAFVGFAAGALCCVLIGT